MKQFALSLMVALMCVSSQAQQAIYEFPNTPTCDGTITFDPPNCSGNECYICTFPQTVDASLNGLEFAVSNLSACRASNSAFDSYVRLSGWDA